MYGVKVADLKVLAKKLKGQHALACELYETGNSDAMYLAGLIADGQQMGKRQLDRWAREASWYMLSEYAVAWVAAESPHGRDRALKWMDSPKPHIASSGWSTYANLLSLLPDEELDRDEINGLLERVLSEIDEAAPRVQYTMNGFVICVGSYYAPLLKQAKSAARKLGVRSIDMGDTSCKVPVALDTIDKIEKMGRVGRKRKTAKC